MSLSPQLLSGSDCVSEPLRLGVIADLHGGLAVDAESRLKAFLEAMAESQCDVLIQLGDFAFPNQKHQTYADQLNQAHENVVHVIGNHEFDFELTREDCKRAWGMESAYYARDVKGIRLLVLDGNEKGSPKHRGGYPSYIGEKQQRWLSEELNKSEKPVVILSHQPLAGQAAIDNAKELQKLLAEHRDKIIVCLNGHSHVDCLLQIDGVSYWHVNSASYYWVGGEVRMAYYGDPLFTTMEIDAAKKSVRVFGKSSTWKSSSPEDIGYFDRDNAPPKSIVVPAIRSRQLLAE